MIEFCKIKLKQYNIFAIINKSAGKRRKSSVNEAGKDRFEIFAALPADE